MRRRLATLFVGLLLFVLLMPPAHAVNEVAIHEIQFTTSPTGESAYAGQVITTGGLVTALYPDGFTLQEPLSAPWTGIWVADAARHPVPGSFVVLSARVAELDGMTALTEVSDLVVIQSGGLLPQPVLLRTSDLAPGSPNAEAYEGVLVSTGRVTIAGVAEGAARWDVVDSSGVPTTVGNRAGYGYQPQLGTELVAVHGVLCYDGGRYTIEPRGDSDIRPVRPRPDIVGEVRLERRAQWGGVIVQLNGLPIAVTEPDGSYAISNVPPGTYPLRAYAPGYLVAERQGVQILPGNTITLPPVTLVGGDVNNDGVINVQDLIVISSNFGLCPPPDPYVDITADGCVNLNDLVLVTQNFGRYGPTPW